MFPLQTVLFPGGLLQLKVFEARYLDLISQCLRRQLPFGVVCLAQGSELRGGSDSPQFESTAVLAQIQDVDAEQAGILLVRCLGGQRVQLGQPHQRVDGLWLAEASACPDDLPAAMPPELLGSAGALAKAIDSMAVQGQRPFALPYRLEDAGWVANRWCAMLPIEHDEKQSLLEITGDSERILRVEAYLQQNGHDIGFIDTAQAGFAWIEGLMVLKECGDQSERRVETDLMAKSFSHQS